MRDKMDKEVCVKAEDIVHVLRDGIALLPGCRDKQGRPLIVFPSREPSVNPDHIRNVLLYLHTVCADEARDRGFVIVIDMRGKQTWNNVKPMLKAINALHEGGTPVYLALIIKPDKFWEKQKAQISWGFCRFEVQMVSVDVLMKYFEPNQLIRELGGSYYYNHDDWLETRLELERWIWQISEIMRGLDVHKKQVLESQSPVDVMTAEQAIQKHHNIKKAILAIPIDAIQMDAQKVSDRVNSTTPNPDLIAALPHLTNLVASVQQLKTDVFKKWDDRRMELENTYQLKLFECDADKLLDWIRAKCDLLQRSMSDVGQNEVEAQARLSDYAEIAQTASNCDINRSQIGALAKRLCVNGGPVRNRVEIGAHRIEEEWHRLEDLLMKRKTLLTTSVAFFHSAQIYFGQLAAWLERPGVDPMTINHQSAEQLEEAIQEHERFWKTVEDVYIETAATHSALAQALKSAGLDESCGGAREQMGRLQRAHKQILATWKDRKVRLHSLLALIAFQTDTQLVVEWLEEHGEPYLLRNIGIGDNLEQARNLHRNHGHFRTIANNTYTNADKLFKASRTIIQSGVSDADRMRTLVGDLDQRIHKFKQRVDARFQLLSQAVLFHTHFNELMSWYGDMERRYADRSIDNDVDACEQSKERWIMESDGTAQAYATTIGEGHQLVSALQTYGQQNGLDYSSSINLVNRLMGEIDQRNSRLTEQWSYRRMLLQVALKFANYNHDTNEIMLQIRHWEEDMKEMLDSPTFLDNAEKVQPFHKDNTSQVKNAVRNIRRSAHELLQAIQGQADLEGLQTKDGEVVLEVVRGNLARLDLAEKHVMNVANETSGRIEGARRFFHIRDLAKKMINTFDHEERNLHAAATIPSTLEEAIRAQEAHKQFQERVENNNHEAARVFYDLSNHLIRLGTVDRAAVVELNEMVMSKWRRLVNLTEERNKLLKAAVGCFKTIQAAVMPILDQMEKDYSQSPDRDWCMARVSESAEKRSEYMNELLAKHMEHKEKFLKGCTYAQKTSELFLKYVQRTAVPPAYKLQHEQRIVEMKGALRERQSRILELWTRKKKQLDRCQQYVLIDASKQVFLDWMDGEGEANLSRFTRHAAGKLNADALAVVLEDFLGFKVGVKEKRSKIQAMFGVAGDMVQESAQHADDIKRCVEAVRRRFEEFSRRVIDNEEALRGGAKPNVRDELSLDRHSDSAVEEKIEKQKKKEIDSKMKEPMRELVKSERDYVEDLGRCVRVYVAEYDASTSSGTLPLALRGRRKEIFGNVEQIYSFHKDKFLRELSKYEGDPEEVGASFTVWVDLLNELYTDYCVNKEQNNQVIAMPEAVQYFSSIRERHQLEVNNDLGSLLIKPVQRITRYRLMMEQLMKSSTGNVEEFREAYEVVLSVPRRANDIIHLNCLEQRDKLAESGVGPFVMQDTLTVWEPRAYFKGRGKERQVFLFELAVVFAKRLDMGPKTVRYVMKGKPVQLNEVSVVEHVEGDSCRFGLRIGVVSSNDNRTDLRANSENTKVTWVKRIRELTQGLYRINLGSDGLEGGGSLSSGRLSSRSSVGENRLSRDAESIGSGGAGVNGGHHRLSMQETDSLGSAGQRFSMQSTSSNEQCAEHWTVSADYDGSITDGHLTVSRGDRVELIESPSGPSDLVLVSLTDDSSKQGLVPFSILLPDQPSSSCNNTDRPDASPNNAVVKRKSLRRILSSNNKERSSPGSPVTNNEKNNSTTPSNCSPSSSSTTTHPVLTSAAEVIGSEADPSETGLPPPMLDLHVPLATPTTTSNSQPTTNGNENTVDGNMTHEDPSTADLSSENNGESEPVEVKPEKTPQETARMKRQYVLMELVETEKDYVRDLLSVVDGYVANCEMNLPEDLVGKDKIIFANIAQIQEFHQTSFLKEIEKSMENYEAAGAAFVKYERRLHTLYVKYCQNKPKSDYLVAQEQFEQFFAETKLKLGHKVALCDLLIKPVQRIMKYQLLLKDILKFTERAGDSVVVLKRALEVMHVVPKACDDMMQVGRLQNFDGNLNAQGKLIFQGTLSISESVGGKVDKGKDRRIFLFEQSVIIADHIPPKKEYGNPTYIFKSQIMVNKMVLDGNVSEDPNKFIIRSNDPAQQTSYVCQTNSPEEKDHYMAAISAQLDQQKTLLAALVDPKRYQSQLAGGIGSMNIEDKKSTVSAPGGSSGGNVFSRLGSGGKGGAAKPESPKHAGKETKKSGGGLFGFGKKSNAKSPTSPPPVGKLK